MLELIRANPLASLITCVGDCLTADHIPMTLSEDGALLRGHVAAANPINEDTAGISNALAIFHGPQHYISPSWHATKREDGRIVPTWNYVVVHVHGRPAFIHDREWLRRHLDDLTDRNEARVSQDWKTGDAPEDYLDRLIGKVVGIEIRIERIVGKWKTTVIRPEENATGVINALTETGDADALAVAGLIGERTRRDGGG